eukprot:Blabericola_migrator_1__1908@NODE_1519_length_4359_cov_139_504194_g999_i0_p1_GENE_NODE_1519_length_4359_cov_139_504194_g999_i0NODE_1519_length_4359_cov_139_504194_g999_i0_p1_ORF_typecomplete_len556_score63_76Bestrophin/PF01062_21/3_1e25DUF674/PF05056_12/0_13_NODE_1519_length_4359_cov_139_504194_g999_i03001967
MSVRYRMRRWYDHWLVLCYLKGSVFPRALFSISFSTLMSLVYWMVGVRGDSDHRGEGGGLMGSPQIYGYFMQTAALILAFTTGISYNRFWEALEHLTIMTNAMCQAASMVLAFDECSVIDGGEAPLRWRAITLHYFSILHAACCQKLFSVDGVDARLDILGGLTENEKQELSSVSDQAALVFHWINERISSRVMNGGLRIPAPICSQLWSQLTAAMKAYASACKILDTPLPLPYQQSLAWSDLIVIFLTPFCICSYVESLMTAAVFSFCTVMLFHGIYLADVTMQQPFGNKSNDLPVVERHKDFIDQLVSFVTLDVANEINKLYQHVDSFSCFTASCSSDRAIPTAARPVTFRAIEVIPRRHSEDPHKLRRQQASALLQGPHIDMLATSNPEHWSSSQLETREPPRTTTQSHPTSAQAARRTPITEDLLRLEPSPTKQLVTYRSSIPSKGIPESASAVLPTIQSPSRTTATVLSRVNSKDNTNEQSVEALFLGGKILAKEYVMPASKGTVGKESKILKRNDSMTQAGSCAVSVTEGKQSVPIISPAQFVSPPHPQ